MRRCVTSAAAMVLVAGAAAHAERFTVAIDPALSQVTATLTIQGQSAVDTSPVTGFVELSLDTVGAPVQVRGRDLRVELTETLNFNISFGFLGQFNSTLAGLVVQYANPGTVVGPVPIDANGAFLFAGVPADLEGVLNYTATGLVCAVLLNSTPPLPCTDTDDLSTEPTQSVDFDAVASISGRTVTLTASIDRTAPIDAANPSLGTIRVVGTVRGSVVVPVLPGDADASCNVNFTDITAVLANFGTEGPGVPGDTNADDVVNFTDITTVLANFGTSCD
jgi:hypothetical protein